MRFSKYEFILACYIGLSFILQSLLVHFNHLTLIVFVVLGLCFEFATASLWTYNKDLYDSPLTVNKYFLFGLVKLKKYYDVNLLFGLGWLSFVLYSYTFKIYICRHTALGTLPDIIPSIISLGIVGNLVEQFYYFIDLFTYTKDAKMLRFPAYIGKYIVVWGIPLNVRVGYFFSTGLFVYFLVHYLSKF